MVPPFEAHTMYLYINDHFPLVDELAEVWIELELSLLR